ncbi:MULTISPECIES: aldehyde dehydrogenase family protein [Pseudomonas]|jgi:NAD-dependent aldehyde dehydrogenases|uniref:aldehyde dehydrogenase family protein n=1 Tax=Pseudomonas TaxID=286 RepID=UPI0014301775|nr:MULTISPECIES: aldehyde dehydrogenase family protein [Pseudomonas]NJJ56875.1 aldehyde dehydrogenase family protein [Pseudomonas sp. B14(2022)]WGT25651.1 aldehyde dehydrogenase family protein [Pseudomonas marginalis]
MHIALLPSVVAFLGRDHSNFIDGVAHTSASTQRIGVVDPGTGETVAQLRDAQAEDVNLAVDSATAAFKGAWAQVTPYQRGVLLNRLADLIEANGEELAQLETLSSGKSINLSRHIEVGQSAVFLRYFAGWATKIGGQTMTPSFPSMAGEQYSAYTLREPVGVVAAIVPWNFSLMIGVWKLGAALTTGCTVVLKPSEYTPLSLLRLAELAIEAGIAPGVINVVNGRGQVGQQLIEHQAVRKVSFTGSVPTGIAVGKAAMAADLTRVTLELGGKNAAALLADANVDDAVARFVQSAYVHQGQVCAAPERLFVHRSIVEQVTQKMAAMLSQMVIGSPLDEHAQFGPLSNKPHFDKILGFFDRALQSNQVVCGARAVDRAGYYVEPTLIIANGKDDPLLHEETFGPVVCVLAFDDEEELVTLMNDSPFGLTASIWTNDLSRALRLIPRIEAGTVWVNMHTFVDPSVPFGGMKASGMGREFGSAFIDDYTELKSVIIRY